jgi:hypothetical protein
MNQGRNLGLEIMKIGTKKKETRIEGERGRNECERESNEERNVG